ncbi:cache domain-containing sensor histidine kinase [Clostridium akagii]|uniref:cache domain-containing sensor histidine kinase n=1 Tax=Clostridium akagii TaxID=91623 RepID=UPI00047AE4C9|nr:sensor histidine kinase [Clostridium akagii]
MYKVKGWLKDLKISTKIIVYYLVLFILSISFITLFFIETDKKTIYDKVKQMSVDAVKSISSKMDYIVDITDNQSKMLISSQTIQNILRNGSEKSNFTYQQEIDNYMADFMNFNDNISSIYIFDNYGNKYFIDNTAQTKNINLQSIKASSWYNNLIELRGGYLLKLNGGGTFQNGSQNYVSIIRVINDLNTQKIIGIMVINIPDQYINDTLYDGNASLGNIILLDEKNHNIINEDLPANKEVLQSFNYNSKNYSEIQNINSKQYIITELQNKYGWKIISINLFNESTAMNQSYNVVLLIGIILDGVLLIVGLLFSSLIITRPIQTLIEAMKEVELGKFKEVNIKTCNDEIGELKNIYNIMICQIKKLFIDIIEENRTKRKAELDVLQQQIKPHFLYNSFDAISSLILSKENDEAFEFVNALGQFYRSFLSNGNEEITIKEEVDMVRHYLTVQKIRLGGKFTIDINIDSRVLNIKIPRLTLQPIVENAINHGIRGKLGTGKITIYAMYYEDHIILSVEDDGIGIDEKTVENIKKGIFTGVGLRATIERVNIYYNSENIIDVQSEKSNGTKVTITIPQVKES